MRTRMHIYAHTYTHGRRRGTEFGGILVINSLEGLM